MSMSTTRAVLIHQHGGPEVLQEEEIPLAAPRAGELLLRQTAIGLNFAEVYQRKGEAGPHRDSKFPIILGSQGAGVVEAVGEGVTDFAIGEHIACLHPGAYCERRVIPAARAVKLPPTMNDATAAALLLRGMTAEYLLHRLYRVESGDTILVHAAAGGMGVLLSQWARALGARVIGTAGGPAKCAYAMAHGCHAVIDYRSEDFVERVAELTEGAGVHVVYDAVGRDVFVRSLECLRPMGWAISYGAASGPVQAFDLQLLHHKSLIVSRPTLRTYTATSEMLRASATAFFEAIANGWVVPEISRRYPFAHVREAHADLEGRQTVGSPVLIP